MHTIMVMGGGFTLLVVCILVGRSLGSTPSAGMAAGAVVFLPIWLAGAAINMWVGVKRAGYSVADEAPIFLVIFAVPAAVALLVWWKVR
jgi:hypothetical protein